MKDTVPHNRGKTSLRCVLVQDFFREAGRERNNAEGVKSGWLLGNLLDLDQPANIITYSSRTMVLIARLALELS
jgi:hypothetical protein